MVMVIGRLLAGVFPLRRSFLFLSVPACTGFVFRVSIKKIKGKKKKYLHRSLPVLVRASFQLGSGNCTLSY